MPPKPTTPPTRRAPKRVRPTKARRALGAAVAAGTVALAHREKIIQALELLRRSRTVTAEEEARVVAAYDQGAQKARAELAELLERLQLAAYGEVVVSVARESGAAARAIGREARAASSQLRRDAPVVARQLRRQGREAYHDVTQKSAEVWGAVRREGDAVVQRYQGELQAFLDRNRPTVEAVERASHDLANAGRELAASLKYAGREFADEVLRQGRRALTGIDVETYETAALEWSAQTIPRTGRAVRNVFVTLGLFVLTVGALIASVTVPQIRPYAVGALAGASLLAAVALIVYGIQIHRFTNRRAAALARLATLSSAERYDYLRAASKDQRRLPPRAGAGARKGPAAGRGANSF